MGAFVTTGAMMTCSFGLVPCPLTVLPARTVMLNGRPKANITDFAPIVNIASFGMCSAPTNPTVIAATAAAMGVFTPMPCIPAIVSPWIPGYPLVLVQGMPALTDDCRNMCMWLGVISFTQNGQIPMPGMPSPPPLGNCLCIPSGLRAPLTPSEMSSLGSGGGDGGGSKEQYEKDVKKASQAGDKEKMMGDAYEKAAKDFEKAGEKEKAAMAHQQAEKAYAAAEDKRNEALGDVYQQYRETLPPSQEDLAKLNDSQRQDFEQKRQAIQNEKERAYKEASIDKQVFSSAASNMTSPDNYSSMQKMEANKDTGLMPSMKNELQEHYAQVEADQKAAEAMAQLNRETHRQIQENECCCQEEKPDFRDKAKKAKRETKILTTPDPKDIFIDSSKESEKRKLDSKKTQDMVDTLTPYEEIVVIPDTKELLKEAETYEKEKPELSDLPGIYDVSKRATKASIKDGKITTSESEEKSRTREIIEEALDLKDASKKASKGNLKKDANSKNNS